MCGTNVCRMVAQWFIWLWFSGCGRVCRMEVSYRPQPETLPRYSFARWPAGRGVPSGDIRSAKQPELPLQISPNNKMPLPPPSSFPHHTCHPPPLSPSIPTHIQSPAPSLHTSVHHKCLLLRQSSVVLSYTSPTTRTQSETTRSHISCVR